MHVSPRGEVALAVTAAPCHLLFIFVQTQALLKTYNIGLDSEERNKAMVNAVAKRVGFKMPDAHVDTEVEKEAPSVKYGDILQEDKK